MCVYHARYFNTPPTSPQILWIRPSTCASWPVSAMSTISCCHPWSAAPARLGTNGHVSIHLFRRKTFLNIFKIFYRHIHRSSENCTAHTRTELPAMQDLYYQWSGRKVQSNLRYMQGFNETVSRLKLHRHASMALCLPWPRMEITLEKFAHFK